MRWILDIGYWVQKDPSRRDDPGLQRFLDESASLIRWGSFRAYLSCVEEGFDNLSGELFEDQWTLSCEQRSGIAFFLDLYGERIPPSKFGPDDEDLEAIDERFRELRDEGFADPDKVPEGTPTSHWWWWLPDTPPNDEARSSAEPSGEEA